MAVFVSPNLNPLRGLRVTIDIVRAAAVLTALIALSGFLVLAFRVIAGIGRLVAVVEKVPEEMDAFREELREASRNSLLCLQNHGERIAVVEAMLDLDDHVQASAGPHRRRRGRKPAREDARDGSGDELRIARDGQ